MKDGLRQMTSFIYKFRKTVLFLARLLTFALFTFIFVFCRYTFYPDTITIFFFWGNYVILGSYVFVLLLLILLYGGFQVGLRRLGELIYSTVLALFMTDIIMYIQLCLVARKILDLSYFFLMFTLQVLATFLFCYLTNRLYFMIYKAREVVLICNHYNEADDIRKKLNKTKELYKLAATVGEDQGIERITEISSKYDSILLYNVSHALRAQLLAYCFENDKRVYIVPEATDILFHNAFQTQIFDCPVLFCKNRGLTMEQQVIKRLVDLLLSGLGLLISFPVMLIIGLIIRLQDGGPALLKQERVTEGGRRFHLYKFRSMVMNAESDGVPRLAKKSDKRITPFGRLIRSTRLDELPQFINIFKGDMSLVGPRPERPELVEEYCKVFPEFKYRLKIKAGLTGLAQIMGRYNTSPRDKLMFDLIYIQKYSFLLDVKLILLTVKLILMKESTEGFE